VQAAAEAIERLDHDAHMINFSVVAQHAGISRAWLYRQPEIRELITRLRSTRTAAPATRGGQRATVDSLRQRLNTATDEINRLRTENTALRDQLARLLGTHRAQLTDPT
jgi:small-conductance mechanosensitive channel